MQRPYFFKQTECLFTITQYVHSWRTVTRSAKKWPNHLTFSNKHGSFSHECKTCVSGEKLHVRTKNAPTTLLLQTNRFIFQTNVICAFLEKSYPFGQKMAQPPYFFKQTGLFFTRTQYVRSYRKVTRSTKKRPNHLSFSNKQGILFTQTQYVCSWRKVTHSVKKWPNHLIFSNKRPTFSHERNMYVLWGKFSVRRQNISNQLTFSYKRNFCSIEHKDCVCSVKLPVPQKMGSSNLLFQTNGVFVTTNAWGCVRLEKLNVPT